jgi:hypothetical protein
LLALLLATSLLVACSSKTSSPVAAASSAKSADPFTQKLQEAAGSGASDCGRIKSQDPNQVKPASDCAIQAAKDKHAFYVAYDMPGLTVGYAGNSQGKLFSVQSETQENAPAGTKAEVKSEPCPAELRIAQSGRVTCMSPAGMGAAGNPHGGMAMPPSGTQNPHGGMMSMPPMGTPNPHGTTQPSHPPASKTPPKQ